MRVKQLVRFHPSFTRWLRKTRFPWPSVLHTKTNATDFGVLCGHWTVIWYLMLHGRSSSECTQHDTCSYETFNYFLDFHTSDMINSKNMRFHHSVKRRISYNDKKWAQHSATKTHSLLIPQIYMLYATLSVIVRAPKVVCYCPLQVKLEQQHY